MFMLEPHRGITPDEWQEIDRWVEDGGTLVMAGDKFGMILAARHYQFTLMYLFEPAAAALTTQTPLLVSSPATIANSQSRAYFRTSRHDFVSHLAVDEGPVLISIEQGEGRVILASAPFPFSNEGLKEDGNGALVLNIVRAADQSGSIWFNEWHHGVRARRTEVVGPGNWLRYTPAGRSLLYGAAVVFVALILRGRRFGRPVPLPKSIARRGPLEYITAIANLDRRAAHRSAVLDQYYHRLKRGLARRYRLDPTLPDDEYVAHLKQLNPNLDDAALAGLLARLHDRPVSENEMIRRAAEAAAWVEES